MFGLSITFGIEEVRYKLQASTRDDTGRNTVFGEYIKNKQT